MRVLQSRGRVRQPLRERTAKQRIPARRLFGAISRNPACGVRHIAYELGHDPRHTLTSARAAVQLSAALGGRASGGQVVSWPPVSPFENRPILGRPVPACCSQASARGAKAW